MNIISRMQELRLPITDQLVLSTWRPDMSTPLFALVHRNREQLGQWLQWVPRVQSTDDSLNFILTSLEDAERGRGLELGIWYNGILAGCIGLHEMDRDHRRASIGYWLGAEFQGKGIVTTSAAALIEYAYQTLDLNRIELSAAVQNTRSRAVAERLGFTEEGIQREAELVDGHFLDMVMYSLLRSEWAKRE